MQKSKEELEELFKEFPGIGPRQAKRFVYFLLWKNQTYIQSLTSSIQNIKNNVRRCQECQRYFDKNDKVDKICNVCSEKTRNNGKIIIIEKNPDFDNLERMNIWNGKYFLIGKNLKITEKEPETKINLHPLIKKIKDNMINEIVFALSLNPEGELTTEWIKEQLYPLEKEYNFKMSILGRGISLGTEVEYSDKITMKEALENRKNTL